MSLLTRTKRFILGEPLTNQMVMHEKLSNSKALAILSSDALSSVAYATEEILIPLAAVGVAAMSWSIPISICIVILLMILSLSYRQTIDAYPQGGGAYTVARENLGTYAGLIAGASLLTDYVLTVAVSTASGVENLASAFPALSDHKEFVGALVICLIAILNLRGVRESASVFVAPTYLFIFSFVAMILAGTWKVMTGQVVSPAPLMEETYPLLPLFLILRAFASGCSALTGVEAISTSIPLFEEPSSKNAKTTLVWMSLILGGLFFGITALCHYYKIVPHHGQTSISLLARAIFNGGPFFYLLQGSTALVLFLAANTGYAGFPRLSSLLAKDRFLPRQMASLGDRLVFSNGILGLSISAIFLIVLFGGRTHYLIPLYAVGVFLSFTLSQAGMVLHHLRKKPKGWVTSCFFNFIGMVTTFVVLIVIASTKFLMGAWMVVFFIPFLILFFFKIHHHYIAIGKELSLQGQVPNRLEPMKHTVIVPISGIHRGVIEALRYAVSISKDVRAVYVEIDSSTTERMREEWKKWANDIPFVVLKSPFRSVIRPLLDYLDDIEQTTRGDVITVLIPEFVTSRWYHQILHNQTALLIRTALLFRPRKVVTSVRYHLKGT